MDVSGLKPGDEHYQAYVGPPGQYDLMGAYRGGASKGSVDPLSTRTSSRRG